MEDKPKTRDARPEGDSPPSAKGTVPFPKEALTYNEALEAVGNARRPGLKVKGSRMPFGGSWSYDKDKDELTLLECPSFD